MEPANDDGDALDDLGVERDRACVRAETSIAHRAHEVCSGVPPSEEETGPTEMGGDGEAGDQATWLRAYSARTRLINVWYPTS